MHVVSHSAADTGAIAAKFAEHILRNMEGGARACVIALRGDLGAGKTTFVQGFAKALGIAQSPKSPTFNLAKSYEIPNAPYHLWHLDCYRLTGRHDLDALDMHAQFANPHNIICIEWPEQIGDGLPTDHIDIRFEHLDGDSRGITLPL